LPYIDPRNLTKFSQRVLLSRGAGPFLPDPREGSRKLRRYSRAAKRRYPKLPPKRALHEYCKDLAAPYVDRNAWQPLPGPEYRNGNWRLTCTGYPGKGWKWELNYFHCKTYSQPVDRLYSKTPYFPARELAPRFAELPEYEQRKTDTKESQEVVSE
jgi:hypothetical protein